MNERQQQHINGVLLFGLVVVLNSPELLPRRRKLPEINWNLDRVVLVSHLIGVFASGWWSSVCLLES